MWPGALSIAGCANGRPLLPLQLVPTRNRQRVRDQRRHRKPPTGDGGRNGRLRRTPSASGKGQEIARCPTCRIALWSHYSGSGRRSSFVRVGTMDLPNSCSPDVRIFTSTRVGDPPEDVPAFTNFYPSSEGVWSDAGRSRWKTLLGNG
jgi:Glutathione-dependent formaldehyde-activating enzyme